MDVRNIAGKLVVAMALGSSALLTGCAINQQVKPLAQRPQQVCIVNNTAVKEGTLEALNEGFAGHGLTPRVVSGTYKNEFNQWRPYFNTQETQGCDALVLYVANWTWDLALYMYYANIWMTSSDGTKELARAMYDSSRGGANPAKFVNGHNKIVELVNAMLANISSQ